MFASFSSESKVAKIKGEFKITDAFLSVLSGVPASVISLWLTGQRQIDAEKALRLEQTCRDLQKIAELTKPWPLSFRDATLWKELLENYRQVNAVAVEKEE
jgi:hypothetical protein